MRTLRHALVLLACVMGCGCDAKRPEKQQALALAQRARELSGQLNQATQSFTAHMDVWLNGRQTDLPAMEKALEALLPLPAQFQQEFEKLPVPQHAPTVTAYRTAVLEFIQVEKDMVKSLQRIMALAQRANPAPEVLRQEGQQELEAAAKAEHAAIRSVENKARAMQSFLLE